jgi:tRNA A-37 threonylcarbamoyl transferase component Bud32
MWSGESQLMKERRKWTRNKVEKTGLGLIMLPQKGGSADEARPLFIAVINQGSGGLLAETPELASVEDQFTLFLHDFTDCKWEAHQVKVAWKDEASDGKSYKMGFQFRFPDKSIKQEDFASISGPVKLLEDVCFLLKTELLDTVPRAAFWSMLNCLTPLTFKTGEKLTRQGDPGDSLFLIQEGTCVVKIETDGTEHQVATMKEGDVVGEMSVLTGEPRYADVIAETDIKVWKLSAEEFGAVSEVYSELRMFLTELVTKRLESSPHTADRTVGKYQIKSKIDQGGWGIVYHGVHKTLNMNVAIKMLKHQMAMDPDFRETFKKEAEIIAKLNHKNIVQVYDIENLYQTMFIIMEFIEGESLESILKQQGALPIPQAINYLTQISSALAYAHSKGIVHQDIKPANILVLPDGQIKILDFGLACPTGTEDMCLVGTVYYSAPEQIDGYAVDGRTDLYCLGIMAYEMVTGSRPYPEDDLIALLDLHIEEDIPDPADSVEGLPDALRSFILTACQRDPEKRFRDMGEALDVLMPLNNELTGDAGMPTVKKKMASMFIFYQDEHQGDLNRLLDDFSVKARELGVVLKAAEFKDIE